MPSPHPLPRRGPLERSSAWLVTGPLGHLYSALADLAAYAASALAERAGERRR